jgi:flagellar FliJ protein
VPNFRFRLSGLLRFRENVRDQYRQNLAVAQRTEDVIRSRVAALNDTLDDLQRQSEIASLPGAIDVDRLLGAHQYEMIIKEKLQATLAQQQAATAEVERQRQTLLDADREVKTLERLRQQQAMRHHLDENRREIKQLDAVVLQRFANEAAA